MNEKKDVEIKAERSTYNNCICDCCMDTSYVTKIMIPKTKYYDGKNLTTKYSNIWICDKCADKLIAALKEGR